MVVCEDGRMMPWGLSGSSRSGAWSLAARGSATRSLLPPTPSPEIPAQCKTTLPPCTEVVLRHYRKLLEHGGPFPDIVLIDRPAKGQLSSGVSGARGAGPREPRGRRHPPKKEELLYTPPTREDSDRARRQRSRAAAAPAHSRRSPPRFAVTFHRRARTMRDLRLGARPRAGHRPRGARRC
jgi:hypothetical protein